MEDQCICAPRPQGGSGTLNQSLILPEGYQVEKITEMSLFKLLPVINTHPSPQANKRMFQNRRRHLGFQNYKQNISGFIVELTFALARVKQKYFGTVPDYSIN